MKPLVESSFIEPSLYQRTVGVTVGILIIVLTIYLLHKFHMKEEHGLPWFLGGAALILFSIFIPLLRLITQIIGAGTPLTALLVGCILFLIGQSLSFALSLSRQKKQIQNLAIEIAILNKLNPIQKSCDQKK